MGEKKGKCRLHFLAVLPHLARVASCEWWSMWVHNFITYDMSCEQVVVKIMIMVLLEKNYLLKKKKKKKTSAVPTLLWYWERTLYRDNRKR